MAVNSRERYKNYSNILQLVPRLKKRTLNPVTNHLNNNDRQMNNAK